MAKSLELLLVEYALAEARGHSENSLEERGVPHFCVHPEMWERVNRSYAERQTQGHSNALDEVCRFSVSPFLPKDTWLALNPAAVAIAQEMKIQEMLGSEGQASEHKLLLEPAAVRAADRRNADRQNDPCAGLGR